MNNREEIKILQKDVDKMVCSKLVTNCKFVYGGQTSQSTVERKKEHHKELKYKGMKIKKICTTTNAEVCREIETYLINKLHKIHGFPKCMNDRNNDGNLANRGGAGIIDKPNATYRIYVMTK